MQTTEKSINGEVMISNKTYLVLIISISLLSQLTLGAIGESTGTGMNVKDEPQNTLWWMRDQTTPGENPPQAARRDTSGSAHDHDGHVAAAAVGA